MNLKVAQLQPAQATFSLAPTNFQEAKEFAKLIAESDLAPKDYRGKPGNVLIAVAMGAEVGLKAMQSIQNIAVINGRPSIWGDAVPAIIKVHPHYEWMKEWFDEATQTAYCQIKRKGEEAHTQSFSESDARSAGLLNKDLYKNYKRRMLQMRARGFAARDVFPDALKGLAVAEDVMYMEKDMGMAEVAGEFPAALQHIASGTTGAPLDLNAALQAKKDAAAQKEAVPAAGAAETPAAEKPQGGEAAQSVEQTPAETGSGSAYTDADAEQAYQKYLRALDLCKTPEDFAECDKMFKALPDGDLKVTAKEYRKARLEELKKATSKPATPPAAAEDMFSVCLVGEGDDVPF